MDAQNHSHIQACNIAREYQSDCTAAEHYFYKRIISVVLSVSKWLPDNCQHFLGRKCGEEGNWSPHLIMSRPKICKDLISWDYYFVFLNA